MHPFRYRPVALMAAALLTLPAAAPAQPRAEVLAVGIDHKFAYDDAGRRKALEPGHDEVAFYSLADPARPRLIGALPLANSIVGPPTNIAVTPDQKLALVANALRSEPLAEGGWKAVPADEVHVVDLSGPQPVLLKSLKVGSQPSGLSISRDGSFALVANRDGRSISVLRLHGADSVVVQTLPMTDSVTSVAITPDGRSALATKFAAHKVAQLSISPELQLTDSGRDLPVGLFPWTVTIAPDGATALVTNIGANAASDGHAKTVSVIDLKAVPVRVVRHVSVGDAPEGVAYSPDGALAAVTILQGSYDAPAGAWWRHANGRLTLLHRMDGAYGSGDSVDVGAFPEGVAFSADGHYVYVGNFASSTLSVLQVSSDGRILGKAELALPGPPASLRVGSR